MEKYSHRNIALPFIQCGRKRAHAVFYELRLSFKIWFEITIRWISEVPS
jgi:hypothetical protein